MTAEKSPDEVRRATRRTASSIFILIGIAFLLDHLGIVAIGNLWRFWPLLVVVAGVINFTSRDRRAWGGTAAAD